MSDEFKNVMKQEDKKLLLKDLCARLPYGVKCEVKYYDDAWELLAIYTNGTTYAARDIGYPIETYFEDCKPYLFPLSSMTEEQKRDLTSLFKCCIIIKQYEIDFPNYEDSNMDNWMKVCTWCYKNHIDIYNLIPKGLAIDATGKNIY